MQNLIIVDNDAWNAERLRKSFKEMNKQYQVIEIFNRGQDAIRYLWKNETKVDFIITDICMPGYPGLELIEQMKRINRQMKCIILSAQKVFEYAMEAIELGVVRYLLKPIEAGKLSQVLDSLSFKAVETKSSSVDFTVSAEVCFLKNEMETNFKDINMDEVAKRLGYSKEYLFRIFKKEMNICVSSFLQNVRLKKAREYLEEPGKYKIYEVCEMVGYDDQMYFSKLFKKKYNVTPKDYQKYAVTNTESYANFHSIGNTASH